MSFWIYVKTVNKGLQIALLISVTTVGLIEFLFRRWPELFPGAAKLADITVVLCLAYISSYIFYFLVVHAPQQRSRSHLAAFVSHRLSQIVGLRNAMIRDLAEAQKNEEQLKSLVETIRLRPGLIPFAQFKVLCEGFNPEKEIYKTSLLKSGKRVGITYTLRVHNLARGIEQLIDELYVLMPYLDSELIRLLEAVKSMKFYSDALNTIRARYGNLGYFSEHFYQYLLLIESIKSYGEKHVTIYPEGKKLWSPT